jgi:hypothetical protein
MFWIFNVDPLIELVLSPKQKLLWSGEYGDTALALYHVEPTQAKLLTSFVAPLVKGVRAGWVLRACDRGESEWTVVATSYVYDEMVEAATAWGEWITSGGSVAAWTEHRAAVKRESFPSLPQ